MDLKGEVQYSFPILIDARAMHQPKTSVGMRIVRIRHFKDTQKEVSLLLHRIGNSDNSGACR
jgi:hypothetical protein